MDRTTFAGVLILALMGMFAFSLAAGQMTGQAVKQPNILDIMYGSAQPVTEQKTVELEYPGMMVQPTGPVREEMLYQYYPSREDLGLDTDRFPRRITGIEYY
jgi:hypothetical protein